MISVPEKFHPAFDRTTTSVVLLLLMILMRDFRVDSITCHLTEYSIEDECCPMCPAGHRVRIDCTEFKSTSCQRCTDGTYRDQPNGLKRCTPCSTCDSGAGLKEKLGCKITADTVCEPMEGFYCTDSTSGGCAAAQKHRRCEPGQFISRMGTASNDTECSECISGSFSNGTMLLCQLHTQCEKENLQLTKAGTASTDAECGEKSSTTTVVVIGVLVVFLVAATIGVFLCKYKKSPILNICTKQQETQRSKQEGEQEVIVGCTSAKNEHSHTDGGKLVASSHSHPGDAAIYGHHQVLLTSTNRQGE